jgi:cytochrome c-type biogenesis protein CcsB
MLASTALLVAALIALAGPVLLGAAAWLAPRSRLAAWQGTSLAAAWLATALLGAALAARAVAAGHAPWSNLHEFSAAFAFGVLVVFLLLARRTALGGLLPLAGLVAAGLLGVSLSQPDEVRPLVPALQAPLLLTIHVGMAMLAYAITGVAFLAAVGELAQRAAHDTLRALPDAEACRAAAHRAAILAFPILTAAIALGSVWANLAWRSYWSNDPKELAAAATWLVYGAYLHVAGRRDRWAAAASWLLVLGFAAVLFTWLGAGLLFVGEHSYAGA